MNIKLATKIYNVMCDTEALEKDLTVGKGQNSYKATGEKAVLNMVKPLFKKNKLIVLPFEGNISENVNNYETSYNGKTTPKLRAITQLKVYFDIVDVETGESTRIVGFGNGADSQDKGSGKAFTYALKVALSKSLLLFSGEDTDNTHSDDINPTVKKIAPATKKMPKPTSDELDNLVKFAEQKGFSYEDLEKVTKHDFNISFTKVNKHQYDKVYARVESK